MSNWFFFYQVEGGEDKWRQDFAENRQDIISKHSPRFTTVLDLTAPPEDGDWKTVKYRGPLYFDFDAGGDIERVCEAVRNFMSEMVTKYDFDVEQARYYASGSKGFHIEIPMECFIPKVQRDGYAWLPYIYKEMAQNVVVDTMDMVVYTGKSGRQWRTPNVRRENGKFKVPITFTELMEMDESTYLNLIEAPRYPAPPRPASCNTALAAAFDRAKSKTNTHMAGRKKRAAKANAFLEPFKRAGRHPQTIERIMRGEILKEDAGFQKIAMQLAIYATSMGMEMERFVDECAGLVSNHESDSYRYNTAAKRKEELRRMWRYMDENHLYDFDAGPLVALVKKGVDVSDLGLEYEDSIRAEVKPEVIDGEVVEGEEVDTMARIRKGFLMTKAGMVRRTPEGVEPICRATFEEIQSFHTLEGGEFNGYEISVKENGRLVKRCTFPFDVFTSANSLRKFLLSMQTAFSGTDTDTVALFDTVTKSVGSNMIYTYPREGLFVTHHPDQSIKKPVIAYLTQTAFITSVDGTPDAFQLRYKPEAALSQYQIDIDKAPALEDFVDDDSIDHLFRFSRPDVVGWLLGWFCAAHYRSFFLHAFDKFPLLQVQGQAGAGKTQTMLMLARLHWYRQDVPLSSATSFTPFSLDNAVSTSTSAPCIIDEYKPREMKVAGRGKYEKIKDAFKASYTGDHIGNRGHINKAAASGSGYDIIKAKVTAPIVFMCEALESETAILERCVTVTLSQNYINEERRNAFEMLKYKSECMSAVGKRIVEMGFHLDLDEFHKEILELDRFVRSEFLKTNPEGAPDRVLFNKTVTIYGLKLLRRALSTVFGERYNAVVDELIDQKLTYIEDEGALMYKLGTRSEIAKVVNQIAQNSFETESMELEFRKGKDYVVDAQFVDIRVDKAYQNYRKYCARIHDRPLFDNADAFKVAIFSFSAVVDRHCIGSPLREADGETVVRLDKALLQKAGVQEFRS